jgi:hypothetical protein
VPAQLTYPGVYIEEVPSAVRTITGAATSIAALVGRTARGPVNEPLVLTSFGDFERRFGVLTRLSMLPFAVRDFFNNGGRQAIVVRLYIAGADPDSATIDANGLLLRAASPGSWGNALRARVEFGPGVVSPDLADQWAPEFPGITEDDLFNLIVRDTSPGGATEEYRNVTVVDSPRRLDAILENLLARTFAIAPEGSVGHSKASAHALDGLTDFESRDGGHSSRLSGRALFDLLRERVDHVATEPLNLGGCGVGLALGDGQLSLTLRLGDAVPHVLALRGIR